VFTGSSAYNVVQTPVAVSGLIAANNYEGVNPLMGSIQNASSGSSYAVYQFPDNPIVVNGANPSLQGTTALNGVVRERWQQHLRAIRSSKWQRWWWWQTVPVTIVHLGSRPMKAAWYHSRKYGEIRALIVSYPHGKLLDTDEIDVQAVRQFYLDVTGTFQLIAAGTDLVFEENPNQEPHDRKEIGDLPVVGVTITLS